jgi:hypothetical protein
MAEKQQWTNYRGKRRRNMDGFWYTVGDRTGGCHYGKPLYEIIFDSGYRVEMTTQDIWRNKLKDWGSPSVMGVGIVGWLVPNPTKHPLWSRWLGVLRRCLPPHSRCYEDVTVCDRWLRFDLFVHDLERLDGYDPARLGELQLDKDKLGPKAGPRVYSPETCSWLTGPENVAYRRPTRRTNAPHCPYRGVHFTENLWLARPQIDGCRTYIGSFPVPLDAALAIHFRFPAYYFPHEVELIRQAILAEGRKLPKSLALAS